MKFQGTTEFPEIDLRVGGEAVPCPRSIRVLAVDDSPDMLAFLEKLLTGRGHQVLTAANGHQAVEEFTLHEPDLVLMDIVMPGIDGFETTRRIKALSNGEKWVPVVMLTGLDDPEDFERGLRSGADDYLTKPINAHLLTTKIGFMQRVLAIQSRLLELRRFQTLFDNLLEGIVATNDRGAIVSFNHAAERIFGYSADEVMGRNVSVLMSIPDAHRHDAYMARYRSSGQPTVMGAGRDIFGRRKDGSIVPISVGLTEVEWAGARHFLAVVADISERKRMEQLQARTATQLQRYHERSEEEKRITRELVDRIVRRTELDDPLLQWHVCPSEIFSGDIIAAHRAPDRRLFVLSADATGHGLAAAISLLPVVGIFYAMVGKGFGVAEIVAEMNRRLKETMPIGRFLAASVVAVDEKRRLLEIWSGGMPEHLLCLSDGSHQRLTSDHVALGIEDPQHFNDACRRFQWERPGYLVTLSDGVLEARNHQGTPLGMDAICRAVNASGGSSPFPFILDSLNHHLAGAPPHDDISIAVIRLN